jgi:thioredoxin 1
MKVFHKENFDSEVFSKSGLVLVDFWSESCEDCADLMPEIEELESKFEDGVVFGKVDIKGNRRLAIREKVLGLPTVLIYKDGKQLASFSKEIDVDDVNAKLKELLDAK